MKNKKIIILMSIAILSFLGIIAIIYFQKTAQSSSDFPSNGEKLEMKENENFTNSDSSTSEESSSVDESSLENSSEDSSTSSEKRNTPPANENGLGNAPQGQFSDNNSTDSWAVAGLIILSITFSASLFYMVSTKFCKTELKGNDKIVIYILETLIISIILSALTIYFISSKSTSSFDSNRIGNFSENTIQTN